jgi:hypothetical protein
VVDGVRDGVGRHVHCHVGRWREKPSTIQRRTDAFLLIMRENAEMYQKGKKAAQVTSRLVSFLVKRPGGSGYNLHSPDPSKCSKCSKRSGIKIYNLIYCTTGHRQSSDS